MDTYKIYPRSNDLETVYLKPVIKNANIIVGNHAAKSLSNYPFPLFFEEWDLDRINVTNAWDNKGDIMIGNDVWIGYEAVIMQGVHIGDGAIIAARSVITRDVAPYTVVGGVPAKEIRKRFDDKTITSLMEIKWWDWKYKKIKENLSAIIDGDIDNLVNK